MVNRMICNSDQVDGVTWKYPYEVLQSTDNLENLYVKGTDQYLDKKDRKHCQECDSL